MIIFAIKMRGKIYVASSWAMKPELMYKLFSGVCCSIEGLIIALK